MIRPDRPFRVFRWLAGFGRALPLAFVLPATIAAAQENETPSAPTMQQVEKAWQEGDYVYVRDGLKQLAEQSGTARAQYRYGRVLAEGRGGPQDIPAAVTWLEKAATRNHAAAMTLLARIHLGAGARDAFEEDEPKLSASQGAELLSHAAALGDATAQYYLANLYRTGRGVGERDAQASFNWLLAAAEQQHLQAQYELSLAYSQGLGTEADTAEAMTWMKRAAENGHASAQYSLAIALESAEGTDKDTSGAMTWYRRAAESGLLAAQRDLGTHYLKGDIVAHNTTEGLRWLHAAARAGEAGAMANLGYAYATGLGVARDDSQAAQWYNRASEYGLGRAMTALAALHEAGRGVSQDMERAIALYRRALETPDRGPAAVRLGQLAGRGVLEGRVAPHKAVPWALAAARDGDETAGEWLSRQAAADVRPALGALAVLYLESPDRMTEGVQFLQRAAQAGDPDAQVRLGRMHMQGELVPLDYVVAHKWFNIAATFGHPEAEDLRGAVGALMVPEQVAKAQSAARHWFAHEQRQPPATEQTRTVTE